MLKKASVGKDFAKFAFFDGDSKFQKNKGGSFCGIGGQTKNLYEERRRFIWELLFKVKWGIGGFRLYGEVGENRFLLFLLLGVIF